jgi:hypothetical protein
MREVDYSDQAISLRIHRVSQLRNLCLELKKAGEVLRKPVASNATGDKPQKT